MADAGTGLGHPGSDKDRDDIPVPGVRGLEHTADVGLLVRAPDLAGLLERAALGMDHLLREAPPPALQTVRTVRVRAADPPALLRAFLREVLFLHEEEAFAPARLRVVEVSPTSAHVELDGGGYDGPPVREIKGVTLHGLRAEPDGGGWSGRVVFDV